MENEFQNNSLMKEDNTPSVPGENLDSLVGENLDLLLMQFLLMMVTGV